MFFPIDKNINNSSWVYKVKPNVNGWVNRFKARLIARKYEQKFGIHFTDIFVPIVHWETTKILTMYAVQFNWPIHQLDVMTIF